MLNIDHNPRSRTWRELVEELTDALIANPQLAREPAAFTTDKDHSTIYYVRALDETSDGDLVLTRGL